ncbi:hypothetical protein G7046_g3800 [Stylonectria norvegica]|nr:hypothetical protein G7046_g3800 [Stylonectria norvegica]
MSLLAEPLPNLRDYDEKRLTERLKTVDQSLDMARRLKYSPTTDHLLSIYRKTVKDALETNNGKEHNMLIRSILRYELHMSAHRICLPNKYVSTEMVEKLAKLRRFEFAVRYGGYMKRVYKILETKAKMEGTNHFEQLPHWNLLWEDVNRDLESGQPVPFKQWESGFDDGNDGTKLSLDVLEACQYIGLNFGIMKRKIWLYAKHNQWNHFTPQPILSRIDNRQWLDLAKTLAQDLRDLPIVTPRELRHGIPLLQDIIETIIEEYFDIEVDGFKRSYRYMDWLVRDFSYDKASGLEAANARRPGVTKVFFDKMVTLLAATKVEQRLKKHSSAHLAAGMAGPPEGAVESGATSTDDKENRLETFKRQRMAWDRLIGIPIPTQRHASMNLYKYQEGFKSLESPVDGLFWMELHMHEGGEK